jgi:hypothetical protein
VAMQTTNTLNKLNKFVNNKIKELETKPEKVDQLNQYRKIADWLKTELDALKK